MDHPIIFLSFSIWVKYNYNFFNFLILQNEHRFTPTDSVFPPSFTLLSATKWCDTPAEAVPLAWGLRQPVQHSGHMNVKLSLLPCWVPVCTFHWDFGWLCSSFPLCAATDLRAGPLLATRLFLSTHIMFCNLPTGRLSKCMFDGKRLEIPHKTSFSARLVNLALKLPTWKQLQRNRDKG